MGESIPLGAAKTRQRVRAIARFANESHGVHAGEPEREATRPIVLPAPLPPAIVAPLISSPDAAISRSLREQTKTVLGMLLPLEEQVLRMHFGIGAVGDYTLDEIGRLFALPRARVRQIESQALRKLRRPCLIARMRSPTRT